AQLHSHHRTRYQAKVAGYGVQGNRVVVACNLFGVKYQPEYIISAVERTRDGFLRHGLVDQFNLFA
ncbi:MAG: hypothetical protein NZ749_04070, partial [bacterium]|nr:hypothetical protein [bacterium]